MNIWKLTFPTINKPQLLGVKSVERQLIAIVIALTPNDARAMVAKNPSFNMVNGPGVCKQLGTAATDLRLPEIVLISFV